MTKEEFNQWLKRLKIVQPSMPRWLADNCEDLRGTLELWHRTLERYTLAEALQVLDDWASGTYPPPKNYERDNLHLHVKAGCDLRRDRDRKRRELEESQQRAAAYEQREATPAANFLASYYDALKLKQQFTKDELSELEYIQRRREILEAIE